MKCLAFNEALASEELFVCNFQQPASRKDPTFAKAKPARIGHPKTFFGIKARPPARKDRPPGGGFADRGPATRQALFCGRQSAIILAQGCD